MKVSDYVIEFLSRRGVTHIFEVVGGMTTHLVDSAYRHSKVRLVSVHHEQAAGFAADAMARVTGIPGIAMATSGPGAINLLAGVGSCYFDSVPAVFITGQVNRSEQKADRAVRQLGFQETDIAAMARPVTKGAWCIQSEDQIPAVLDQAFRLALSGRPGPVLLDIPFDVQQAGIAADFPADGEVPAAAFEDTGALDAIFRSLDGAQRPLILAGGGIHSARAVSSLRRLVEIAQVPVVNSLMAVDVLPYEHPCRVGLIGTYGNRWANLALGRADVLLVLGSRLDVRQTGADVDGFRSGKTIYHVDCDAGEISNRIKGCIGVQADLRAFLSAALRAAENRAFPPRAGWQAEISALRREWPDTMEAAPAPGINPNQLMHELSRASTQAAIIVVDVGNHQMWAAQSLELGPTQQLLTSGGLGAMGYGLPAAVGASYASPGKPILQIAGDGGMQLNLQELQTIAHHKLPVKMVVVNNRSYGMVRQFQESYFDGQYPATVWGYSAPDFAAVAQAYGIRAMTIAADESALPNGLSWLWEDPLEPRLLQVPIDTAVNAYPKLAFGRPLTEMEPFKSPQDADGR